MGRVSMGDEQQALVGVVLDVVSVVDLLDQAREAEQDRRQAEAAQDDRRRDGLPVEPDGHRQGVGVFWLAVMPR